MRSWPGVLREGSEGIGNTGLRRQRSELDEAGGHWCVGSNRRRGVGEKPEAASRG